ncbi:MAG: hypothetical protein EBU90_14720 [Proteobacteria bacterium]|jgi:hypothetical protein|nr:hypothetical protein [Pseudomonadota bacterium]
MIIEIDTEQLKSLGLSPNEFVYISMLSRSALDTDLKLDVNLIELQTNGWIKIGEDDEVILRNRSLVKEDDFDRMWSSLLSRFPIKVMCNGAVRILRAGDSNAKSNQKSKERYKKYVSGNVEKHNRVIKALETELDFRKRGNNLGWMQMLETWINNHSWEKYYTEEIKDNGGEPTVQEPGRITRLL